jgi:hypothetical protein
MKGIILAFTVTIGLAFAPVQPSTWAQELAQDRTGERFVHPRYGWSVAIPENWPYRPTEGSLLIRTPDGLPSGFFGIYTLIAPDKTLEEVVDSLEGQFKRSGEAKGIEFVIVSRKQIMLAESLPAIEIIKDVGSGKAGKSLRVVVMVDDNKSVVFDGRTKIQSWDALRPYYFGIVKSFSPAQ